MNKAKLLTAALVSSVVALAGAGSAQAATDYFMKVTVNPGTGEQPIVGESVDREFSQTIELDGFSFGAEQTATIGSATGGSGAGKAKFLELKVEKPVDSTTPRFLRLLATGGPLTSVEIIARRAGASGTGVVPMRTLFNTVFVTKQEQSAGGDEDMRETLTFAYGAMAQAAATAANPTRPSVFASWSVITNTPVKDLALPYKA